MKEAGACGPGLVRSELLLASGFIQQQDQSALRLFLRQP